MARFLFGTIPLSGHVNPGLPIARALVARGHTVRWYTGRTFRARVEATGATWVPLGAAPDFDDGRMDEAFPARGGLTGLARMKFDLGRVFTDSAPRQLADLEAEVRAHPADVLVGDTAFFGAPFFHARHGVPWATFGITAMTLGSADAPPFGLGLAPLGGRLGRLRNRTLGWAVSRVVFSDLQRNLVRVRGQLGLAQQPPSLFDVPLSPYLYLQGTVPGFEYPRRDLPPQVHFVGALLPPPPASWEPPDWWGELEGGRPVVHVTQGTLATEDFGLLRAALAGLAREDVLVVATTGGRPVEAVGLAGAPANARVATFLPYAHLLPRVAAMVTNCGYGGVQCALAHGVPLVAAGDTEEKPEVANRIAWAGVGLDLRTGRPSPAQVRRAVRAVLDTPGYRARARALQAEMARHDAPTRAAGLLEQLAATGRPVLRGVSPAGGV